MEKYGVLFCICLSLFFGEAVWSQKTAENTDSVGVITGTLSTTGSVEKNDNLSVTDAQAADKSNQSGETMLSSAMDDKKVSVIPGGTLFGTFAKEDGPFLLQGTIIIPAGEKLEFGPGTMIYIGGKYSTIIVYGQLKVNGTPAEPVVFQSAQEKPNPWDWDRIYIRSRMQSELTNCIVRHSNYGLFVESGSVLINRSLFERNSINGLVLQAGSQATVVKSRFLQGHVVAIVCCAGSILDADSLVVVNNITGVACDYRSTFNVQKGAIKGNTYGIVARKGAAVSVVGTDIAYNRIGAAVMEPVPKRMREMIYGNGQDISIISAEETDEFFKQPERVRSGSVTPVVHQLDTTTEFKSGFVAVQQQQEAVSSLIGNVTAGFSYFKPVSRAHPIDGITYTQTKYLGSQSDQFYSGLQPEFVIFTQGKRGAVDINFNTDFYANQWIDNQTHIRANLLTLGINYLDYTCTFGDFYENGTEATISNRKLRGFRFTGGVGDMGPGVKKFSYRFSAGQSEARKEAGEHDPDIFGKTIDTGFSVRQQLTYVVQASYRINPILTFSARSIIARDQDQKGIFSFSVGDTTVAPPMSAQTGCLGVDATLLDGALEMSAEVDAGSRDTIKNEDYDRIAWYNPQIPTAVSRVFSSLRPDSQRYAVCANVKGTYQGWEAGLTGMHLSRDYFSAGNPFLENDRRSLDFKAQRQFNELATIDAGYQYNKSGLSSTLQADGQTPQNSHQVNLHGEYRLGQEMPTIAAGYSVGYLATVSKGVKRDTVISVAQDTTITGSDVEYSSKELDNSANAELKQTFSNGIEYSLRYGIRRNNDLTDYLGVYANDKNDQWENEGVTRFGFKIGGNLANRTSFRIKIKTRFYDSSKDLDYRIDDNIRLTLIQRKLTLGLTGIYRKHTSAQYDNAIKIATIEKGLEAVFKYNMTSRVSTNLNLKYEDSYDETAASSSNYRTGIGGLQVTYLF